MVRVREVGRPREKMLSKVVYVQVVAELLKGPKEEEEEELWMVVDAEAYIALLRSLVEKPLQAPLGKGLVARSCTIRHTPYKPVPLVVRRPVKNESHKVCSCSHEVDAAA